MVFWSTQMILRAMRCINKLFSNRNWLKSMGANNVKLVRTEFCIDGVVYKYQQLYQTVHESCLSKKL